ncbi:MAG: trimeric intracellular cation channel family protein, partial [Bradyrhizobium sp.]
VLREDLYAIAALAGAAMVAIGYVLHLPPIAMTLAGAALCFGLRLVAMWRGWHLPIAHPVLKRDTAADASDSHQDKLRRL